MRTDKQAVYFIGWDYATANSLALKALLKHEASPWQVQAIVHDEVWVDSVDEVPLITTSHFLALAQQQAGLCVVIQVRDPVHRQQWLRRVRDLGLRLLDEGEAFVAAARDLRARGAGVDLDLMRLPDAFDAEAADALAVWQGRLPDAPSNAVLRAYLQFLQTGLLSPLKAVTVARSSHPILRRNDGSMLEDVRALGGGLAWEVAPQRSNFLEQVLLVGGRSRWRYAFSAMDAAVATAQARLLDQLLAPLGVHVQASVGTSTDWAEQAAVAGYAMPDWSEGPCLARIDVPHPHLLVDRLRRIGRSVRLQVRVGDTPGQLLHLLHHFPDAVRQLSCDRPGPRGLWARLVF